MSKLQLSIDSNELYDFFILYDQLSPLRKKIFQAVVGWCRKYPCVFPNQQTVATKVGCCRQAVSEAFRIFDRNGWLNRQSRGYYKSKKLFVPQHLLLINFKKKAYHKSLSIDERATYPATEIYNIRKPFTSRAGEIHKESFTPLQPSFLGQKLKMSEDGSLKLSLVAESIQQEALRIAKNLGKNGWRPDNPEKYFLGIAFGIAKKQGVKIHWGSYYKTKGLCTS